MGFLKNHFSIYPALNSSWCNLPQNSHRLLSPTIIEPIVQIHDQSVVMLESIKISVKDLDVVGTVTLDKVYPGVSIQGKTLVSLQKLKVE